MDLQKFSSCFYFIIAVTRRRDFGVRNPAVCLCVPVELDRAPYEWDLTSRQGGMLRRMHWRAYAMLVTSKETNRPWL